MLLIGRDGSRTEAQSGSVDSVEFTVRVEFTAPFFSVEITRLCSAQLGSHATPAGTSGQSAAVGCSARN